MRLAGSITHVCDNERYRWLSDVVCTLTGEIRLSSDGNGFDAAYDVAELAWQPLA